MLVEITKRPTRMRREERRRKRWEHQLEEGQEVPSISGDRFERLLRSRCAKSFSHDQSVASG